MENTKMTKFVVPSIKEYVHMSVSNFGKFRGSQNVAGGQGLALQQHFPYKSS